MYFTACKYIKYLFWKNISYMQEKQLIGNTNLTEENRIWNKIGDEIEEKEYIANHGKRNDTTGLVYSQRINKGINRKILVIQDPMSHQN